MASFHSALSLVVLALISSCLAGPLPRHSSMETSSPFDYELTTRGGFRERAAFDDVTMSSTDAAIKRSAEDSLGADTFSTERMLAEEITRDPRTLNDMVTGESVTFTPTTQYSHHKPREMQDSSATTFEPTTERAEIDPRGVGMGLSSETEPSHIKREFSDLDFTTLASSSGVRASELPATELPSDFTTNDMPEFTSTSSAVAPELYKTDSFTTQKYTGLLGNKDDLEEGTDNSAKPKKPFREPEEEQSEGEKRKPVYGKNKEGEEEKPRVQHDKEGSEEKSEPKHGKGKEDEEDKPREQHDKEGSDEEKPKAKHGKGQEDDDEKPREEHDKAESKGEEPKPKPTKDNDDEEKRFRDKSEAEKEEHKEDDDKEYKGEQKFRGSYRKDDSEREKPAREGSQGTEEERQPTKQSAESFKTDDRQNIDDGRLTPSRRPSKADSDDDTHYPKAIYDRTAWKDVSRVLNDFAVLEESVDVVTLADKSHSAKFAERPREDSKLNQGEESTRAD